MIYDKDNFWAKFIEYKKLRDDGVQATVDVLNSILENDEPFTNIVKLNPNHENYEYYKEIIEALQIYHNQTIEHISNLKDLLTAGVNYLD